MERGLVKIYLILDAFVVIISLFVGKFWFLNTQISFFITMLIAFISYKNYKNLLNKELHSGKYDNLESDEILKISKFQSAKTFLSPFKFVAYSLFGLSIFILAKLNLLNPLALLVGVFIYPLGAFIYGVFYDKS